MSVTLGVGSRLPAYCTALGRVLLAYMPDEQAAAELGKVELVAHTKHTITSRRKLEETLLAVRTEGYALNDQELEIGLRSIAVPVRNVVGVVVAAMNVSSQASRISRREMLERCLPVLRAAAERLGSQLPPSR
jgi:IclR family pca regulon transcriptional regulator